MIHATSYPELERKLEEKAYNEIDLIISKQGLSQENLDSLETTELKEKLEFINQHLDDKSKAQELARIRFKRDEDFQLPKEIDQTMIGWNFGPEKNLLDKKKYVLDLIKRNSTEKSLQNFDSLIETLDDAPLKTKLKEGVENFKNESGELAKEERKLDEKEKQLTSEDREIERSQRKLDLLDKKSKIWTKILSKEAMTPSIGGFLLILLSLTLVVAMFVNVEITETIETSFLLILGYFFGQSLSSDKPE
jgi:hypothetical protein